MKKLSILLLALCACLFASAQHEQKADEAAIRNVLAKQVAAWNEGNIDEFMQSYWKSDSLLFVGSKVTSGWDSTLLRYKRSYPNTAAMGKLQFKILRLDNIAHDSYLITGKYFLKREKDNPSGIFTLVFKKKKGMWVIIYDHTS